MPGGLPLPFGHGGAHRIGGFGLCEHRAEGGQGRGIRGVEFGGESVEKLFGSGRRWFGNMTSLGPLPVGPAVVMTVFHGMCGAFRWNRILGKPDPAPAVSR